jgi:NlpC/P60 family
MKNLLFVSVALCVFTVTSPLTALAQPKKEFLKDMNGLAAQASRPLPISKFANYRTNYVKAVNEDEPLAIESCIALQFKFAQLLNRDVEAVTNIELFNFIEEWWATRYRYGGTTKRGVDCSSYTGQLIQTVYGFTMPRTAREQYRMSVRVRMDELQEGDLVFFNTRGGVSHVGLYLGDGYFTHSSSSHGVTISNLNEAYYSRKYIGGGRVVEPIKEVVEEPIQEVPVEVDNNN